MESERPYSVVPSSMQLDSSNSPSRSFPFYCTDDSFRSAHHIHNQILPPSSRIPLFFARGSYFTYRGPGLSHVSHLLYPCPDLSGSLAGLGTHLTLNLADEIRFGPDVEWIKAPIDEQGEDESDFWGRELVPKEERLEGVFEAVRKYLPGVSKDGFETDCSSSIFPSPLCLLIVVYDRRGYPTEAKRTRRTSSGFLNLSSTTRIYFVARYRIAWIDVVTRDSGEGGEDGTEGGVGIGKGRRGESE